MKSPATKSGKGGAAVRVQRLVRPWVRVRGRKLATVDFGHGEETVRLLTHRDCILRGCSSERGRVYRAESILTGRQDLVGVEWLNLPNDRTERLPAKTP